mmetsp:Transcript_15191/g.40767  ORF Transcript_15191/g.40767 Transcript_15191/m.40767 type:complete len:209 (+) Transcript_15191:495-1121(+)
MVRHSSAMCSPACCSGTRVRRCAWPGRSSPTGTWTRGSTPRPPSSPWRSISTPSPRAACNGSAPCAPASPRRPTSRRAWTAWDCPGARCPWWTASTSCTATTRSWWGSRWAWSSRSWASPSAPSWCPCAPCSPSPSASCSQWAARGSCTAGARWMGWVGWRSRAKARSPGAHPCSPSPSWWALASTTTSSSSAAFSSTAWRPTRMSSQ